MPLDIILFKHVIVQQFGLSSGEGVKLSAFRKHYGIPKSTFYRAVRILIEEKFLLKQKRDSYVVHDNFINALMKLSMNTDGEIQPKFRF